MQIMHSEMRSRMMALGGVVVVAITGTLLVVENQLEGGESVKESSLTVEQWHEEYSGPFLKQMAAWRQLSQDLGMAPEPRAAESSVPSPD